MTSDERFRTGSETDPWRGHYAARAAGMTASETRALFAVASRPEVVSLAGGMPNVSALPIETVASMMAELVADKGAQALQYGSAQGDPGLREQICEVMAMEAIVSNPDEVVVTVGSQQGLDLLARVFLDPGDVVLTEAPTYVAAIGTFSSYQATVIHTPIDGDGLVPEALTDTLGSVRADGRRVKFLYTVPTFQNPAGVTMSSERRARVLEVCRRFGALVIEDNPYGLLAFDGEPVRALRADAVGDVVYLSSFSKTLAPGLRVGWVLAPPAIRDKLVLAAESAILSHSPLAQLTVERYLVTQPWREQLKVFREMYRERCEAMLGALAAHMPPETAWTTPGGGFFVWLMLPPGIDSKAMLPRAVGARVAYVPGTGFYADGSGHGALRLSFCYSPPERIRAGVARLADVIRDELRLQDTFGPAGGPIPSGRETPGPD